MPHTPTIQEKYDLIMHHLSLSVASDIWYQEKVAIYDHNQGLEQPTLVDLEILQKDIITNPSSYNHSFAPVEFRKYLFRYVHGLEGSKAFKKRVPPAKTYIVLK
jgi:hypothetical protein